MPAGLSTCKYLPLEDKDAKTLCSQPEAFLLPQRLTALVLEGVYPIYVFVSSLRSPSDDSDSKRARTPKRTRRCSESGSRDLKLGKSYGAWGRSVGPKFKEVSDPVNWPF